MILAIDIGNTTTNFGVFDKRRLAAQFSVATQPNRTADEITLQLKALAKTRHLHLARASRILICSVVPRMTAVLTEALKSLDAIPIQVIGQDLKVPLKNRYTYPEQVGQDRLVGAYAAWRTYKNECIVADFGTAITIDVVTKKGEYLGGVIAPGLDISLEALATRTALLPKVELKEPPELLGRDTANSIRSGLLYGCVALCDGLVTQLKRQYAPKATVVATGGSSALIAKHARTIDHLKPHLVLEGLLQLTSSQS
ncbi:MAG: type III pantothenate kinase [Candidatus Omnitrophica bacterium]|nr:type III pantothenate kinase [Candidatus Omnitrophota bacterium]